jgi:hypothetical protein
LPLEGIMPIRFRCAYCNQLMAIARRKAGTVVRCPTCAGQVVVPNTGSSGQQEAAQAPSPAAGGVFERSDFDKLLENPAPPPVHAPPPPGPGVGPPLPPLPNPEQEFPGVGAVPPAAGDSGFDVNPVPLLTPGVPAFHPRQRGLIMTPARWLLLLLIVLVLVALAFLAGLLIGQSS